MPPARDSDDDVCDFFFFFFLCCFKLFSVYKTELFQLIRVMLLFQLSFKCVFSKFGLFVIFFNFLNLILSLKIEMLKFIFVYRYLSLKNLLRSGQLWLLLLLLIFIIVILVIIILYYYYYYHLFIYLFLPLLQFHYFHFSLVFKIENINRK